MDEQITQHDIIIVGYTVVGTRFCIQYNDSHDTWVDNNDVIIQQTGLHNNIRIIQQIMIK